MKKIITNSRSLILVGGGGKSPLTSAKHKITKVNKRNGGIAQAPLTFLNSLLKSVSLNKLSKKLLALFTIAILAITTGACSSKKPDNQNSNPNPAPAPAPTPSPTPASNPQLEKLGIDETKSIYVSAEGTNAADCGTTEKSCDLQTAIERADKDGKKYLLVAKGTYYTDPNKTDIEKSIVLKEGLKIYGGFDPSDMTKERDLTGSILEGDLGGGTFTKQILKGKDLSSETVLDGFVIQNAKNDPGNPKSEGAGLYLEDSNPIISNTEFNNNSAYLGGAISNKNSSPKIINSTFTGNLSTRSGGAILNRNSMPSISNSIFSKNKSGVHAGAIFNESSSTNIINCVFIENSTDFKELNANGGAVYNNNGSHSYISNSTFINNYTKTKGGAVYNYLSKPTISNSIFWNNKVKNAAQDVGSIENINNDGGHSESKIKNSILNENSIAGNIPTINTTTDKNKTPTDFKINADGKVDITDADSKALIKDAGDNVLYLEVYNKINATSEAAIPANDKDPTNNPRLNGETIDIGAYELQD